MEGMVRRKSRIPGLSRRDRGDLAATNPTTAPTVNPV
jgi:hypothetical protein